MTRLERMEWCKKRALACIDAGHGQEACTSMLSDLGAYPETESSQKIGFMLMYTINMNDLSDVRRFIIGFN